MCSCKHSFSNRSRQRGMKRVRRLHGALCSHFALPRLVRIYVHHLYCTWNFEMKSIPITLLSSQAREGWAAPSLLLLRPRHVACLAYIITCINILRLRLGTTSASSATSARTPWSARDLFRWGSRQFIKWVFYAHGWYLDILGKG